ncbi:hypothetical protein SLE2022_241670 [Rubroshorea leprosula]
MENKKTGRDGNEEDDQKMEQFFALIRSFREARNRRREELREMEEMKKEKKKMRRSGGEEQSNWIPTFRQEDFTQEIEFRRPPIIFASSCNKKKQPEDNLDLNLRL